MAKTAKKTPNRKKAAAAKTGARNKPAARASRKSPAAPITADYAEYLERYHEVGEGRPRLSPEEFDRLDDELLDLLELSGEPLTPDQEVRFEELKYYLIEPE